MAKFVQPLLLFLLDLDVISSLSLGVFNRCDLGPDVKESPEIYSEGKEIKLCCHTNLEFCHDNMYIKHRTFENQNQTLVMESKKCDITLQIPDAKTWNSGIYTCLENEDIIDTKEVYVVGKPKSSMVILNKKIILKRKRSSFIITFDPGDTTPFDNITVYGDRKIWCRNSSLLCSNITCRCDYQNGPPTFRNRNMTLVIVKTRLNNSIEVKDGFNPYRFIQPKHVVQLKAFDITSSSAKIMWCRHPKMRTMIPFMNLQNTSYGYTFQMLKKLQAVWKKWAATISSPQQSSMNMEIGKDMCITVEVQHLTPYTRYDIKITAKTLQSKSRAEKTSFMTKGDVPRSPPQEILFWAVDEHEILKQDRESPSQKLVALFLIWKPIPHDEKGGLIFYDVEIFGDDSELSHQYNINTSHTIVRNMPLDKDLVIKIWSVNNISRSLNFSELRIPHHGIVRDPTGLESHVDLQKDSAVTYVKLPPGWEVSGVHWCSGHQHQQMDELVICDEFPLVDDSVKYSKLDTGIFKHTVNLKQNISIHNDTVWEENLVVKHYRNQKLNIPHSTQKLKVSVKESYGHISSTLHGWNRKPLKFLLSFIKDGKRMPQLFPFNCYYNSSKDEVKLLTRTKSESDRTFLVLEQQCDFDHPSQYLIEKFKVVFARSTRQCTSVKGTTSVSMKNHIFEQNKIRLPQLPIYACITSEGSRNQKTLDSHYAKKSPDGFDYTTLWTGLLISGSLALLLILCVGCLCYCRKRYTKLSNGLKVPGTTVTRIPDDTFQAQNLIYTQTDSVSDISEYFERDSGFTASSQVSRTLSDCSRPFSELHKSDSVPVVNNCIAGLPKGLKSHVADQICLEEVVSETALSKEQGMSSTEGSESDADTDTETFGISTGQENSSESHPFLMEDMEKELRQKCPE